MSLARFAAWPLVATALLAGEPAAAQETGFTAEQQAGIEAMIRDYLIRHPEVVVEALNAYEQQQAEAEAALAREQIAQREAEIFRSEASPVMGNAAGDVTLVEFFDYQCGYCKRVVASLFDVTAEDAGLRVVFKEFPILGPASLVASRAALAARNQGKYVEFHNAMMNLRGTLTDELIFQTAEQVGLDVDRLRADMDSPEVMAEIEANAQLADAIGVRGTPAFVIGTELVPGAVPIETLRQMIADARAS